MGVLERKAREREALRRQIIEAAMQLFREHGYAAVSMRKIAQRVEYSVGSLYLHYKDKDELFLAVQEEAFARAFAYIQKIPSNAEPLTRLRQLGERYVRFGMENPDLYRLMFMMEHPMQALPKNENWKSGIYLHQFLTQTVRDCMDAGVIVGKDPHRIGFALWSFVHGMVSLRISHRLSIYTGDHIDCPFCNEDVDQLMLETHEHILQMITLKSA